MTPPATDLGRVLRERRRGLGLSRNRLAERCGLSAAEITRWERGAAAPNPDQVIVLAEAVGLDDAETQRWLDEITEVDLIGPEVAVQIEDGDEPAPNPFSGRTSLRRPDPTLIERVRSHVEDLRSGRDTVTSIDPVEPGDAPTRPAPSEHSGLVARPATLTREPAPGVIPARPIAGRDPTARVYSTGPSVETLEDERSRYRTRRIATTVILIGFAIVLRWSIGALGDGLGDFLDLFRSPPQPPFGPTL